MLTRTHTPLRKKATVSTEQTLNSSSFPSSSSLPALLLEEAISVKFNLFAVRWVTFVTVFLKHFLKKMSKTPLSHSELQTGFLEHPGGTLHARDAPRRAQTAQAFVALASLNQVSGSRHEGALPLSSGYSRHLGLPPVGRTLAPMDL